MDFAMRHKLEQEEKGRELAKELINAVNSSHSPEFIAGFVDQVMYSHRTLQASASRMVFELIRGWANMFKEERYDGRNEITCQSCYDIVVYMDIEREGWDIIPFI